jgi:hypothetical protein
MVRLSIDLAVSPWLRPLIDGKIAGRGSCHAASEGAENERAAKMKTSIVFALLGLASCGGSLGDAGTRGHSDSAVASEETDAPIDDSPEPSDGACSLPQQGWVLCHNEWHTAGGTVFPQCPPGTERGTPCTDAGVLYCIACASGTGAEFVCRGQWSELTPVSCSP